MAKERPVVHCVIDGKLVPEDRYRRGIVTCSEECAKARKKQLRDIGDLMKCRWCHRPSSPLERAAFKRFRNFEAHFADLLYPRQWEAWEAGGGDKAGFITAIQEDSAGLPTDTRTNETQAVYASNKDLPEKLRNASL